jgi:hypothetical protein
MYCLVYSISYLATFVPFPFIAEIYFLSNPTEFMGKGKVLRIFDTKAVRITISKRCYLFGILNKADLINIS